jgi:GTPase SAR1 family protein
LLQALKDENVLQYLRIILEFESLSSITKLKLDDLVNDAIIQHIGSLLSYGNLKELRIPNGKISDSGINFLVQGIQKQSTLRILRIPIESYTVQGINQFSTILNSECVLSEVAFSCNNAGMAVIAKALSLNVSIISLGLTLLGDFDQSAVAELTAAFLSNHSIMELSLTASLSEDQWRTILSALNLCPNIQHLTVSTSFDDSKYNVVILVAEALRTNTSFKTLTFEKSDQDCSKMIAEAIGQNVNCILENLIGVNLSSRAARKILGLDKYFQKKDNKTILKFLREMRDNGVTIVKRIKLIFAGNGEVGKSTLIKRLKEGKFEENTQIMTDGIDISRLEIGGIDMTVFDFAGQPEYEHTHSLFFDKNSLFLLLYSPRAGGMERLKVYQQMILNCVPNAIIIFVTTRADEARLSSDEMESIRDGCPNIRATIAVDSKSGTGISELQSILVEIAMQQEYTVKSIPSSFEKFRQILQSFGSTRFSISYEEVKALCSSQLDIKANMIDLALELFLSWGYIHKLSNGDYVLHPQQLADVMACVFTKLESTKSRIGDVSEGVLRHSNEVLDAVWMYKFPTLSKSMWRCTQDEPISPFISLLYQAGLAFELFDSQSKPLGASLVPGLLPLHPCGIQTTDKNTSYLERLSQLFIPSNLSSCIHARVTIIFRDALPTALMGRLQVKLRRMATLGGAWKKGCCLVLKTLETAKQGKPINGPQTTEQVFVQSMVIIYQSRDNSFEIISAGEDTSARSTALSILMSLLQKQFPCVSIETVKLNYQGREYSQDDILDNLSQEFIHHRSSNEKINIGGLKILFPNMNFGALPISQEEISQGNSTNSEYSFLAEDKILSACPQAVIRKLKELELSVSSAEINSDLEDDGDYIFLSDQLLACIPNFLQLMELRFSKNRGLSTLWIIVGDSKDRFESFSPISFRLEQ